MSRKCEICGKSPSVGRRLTYRGLPKRKGGIGLKITGNPKRWFYPNIQKVKVIENGTVRRRRVCTACIRSGRITKAPARPPTTELREIRRRAKAKAAAMAAEAAAPVPQPPAEEAPAAAE